MTTPPGKGWKRLMEMTGNAADRPPPGQTIVVERKEKRGCLPRYLLLLLLGFSLMMNFTLAARNGTLGQGLEERYVAGSSASANKVAVIEVNGLIAGAEVEHALKQVRQAREDHKVKAVVLRVDTPGGTVSGSDRIWRELATLKDKKHDRPVVVSMGGTAASGGYYIAAMSDRIFAEPTTMTGSIGVKLELMQFYKLMEKVGVDVESITTGEWKDSGSMYRPMTTAERDRWKEMIDDAYQRFVRVVAQGRKLSLSHVQPLADGRVYTTKEAIAKKLVDEVGYLDDAIRDAQRRAGVEEAQVVRYAKPFSLADVVQGFGGDSSSALRLDRETLLKLRTPQMLYLAP